MSAIIPNKLVLHEEMDPLGSQVQRIKYESKAGTAKAAGISTIHVPSSRNAYMKCANSWLNFSVKCNINGTTLPTTANTGNLELDPMGAAVFIQKITVLQNDLPVAVLDNYSQIHSILQVSQATAASAGVRSAIDGSSFGMNGVRNTLKGNRVRDWAGPFPAVSTTTACVTPLMSFSLPIVGLLSSANLPMCLLKGGIEIRINWRDDVRKIFTTNAKSSTETVSITDKGSMEFSNINWDAEITTMDDSSQLEVAKENKFESGTVEWSDVFYYAFTNQVPVAQLSTATVVNTIVAGFRYKSLRTIYHAGFALPTSSQFDSVNVPHIFWNDIQYRVAGVEHPKQKIDTLAEVVQQNIASQSNVSQSCVTGLMAHGFTSLNWRPTESVPTVQTRFTDRGVSAVNLESFPDIHNISGVDTTGADVECTFNTIGDGLTTSTLNISQAWVAAFDCIYTIRDGVLRRSN